jgi:hypothetical protein
MHPLSNIPAMRVVSNFNHQSNEGLTIDSSVLMIASTTSDICRCNELQLMYQPIDPGSLALMLYIILSAIAMDSILLPEKMLAWPVYEQYCILVLPAVGTVCLQAVLYFQ